MRLIKRAEKTSKPVGVGNAKNESEKVAEEKTNGASEDENNKVDEEEDDKLEEYTPGAPAIKVSLGLVRLFHSSLLPAILLAMRLT